MRCARPAAARSRSWSEGSSRRPTRRGCARPAWRRSTRRRTSSSRGSCATWSRSSRSATGSPPRREGAREHQPPGARVRTGRVRGDGRAPDARGGSRARRRGGGLGRRGPRRRREPRRLGRGAEAARLRGAGSDRPPRAVSGAELGARLRERDLGAAPAALNLLENRAPARRSEIEALLAEVSPGRLGGEAPAHVVGVTGPPGAGKSTLLSLLVRVWRARERTVAVLAVDPSSKRSGGALLGDRARIDADPADRGVFVRSTAAGERLGGLAPATRAATQALAAAFDVVVVETVGVGQSETEVAEV